MNKLFISLFVLVAAFAGLLMFQASRTQTSIVMTPSEINEKGNGISIPRVRVAGRIAADAPIQYKTEPYAELSFAVHNPGGTDQGLVKVLYKGLKPDMFAAGRDVIIDGEYKNELLIASSLLTQCPSKYEPPSPEKSYPAQ